MNKEIKEILDYIKKWSGISEIPMLVKLEDYITNLQERIDKAVEYINNHKEQLSHSWDEPDCNYWIATNPDDLLNILRGEDENK